jgi:hypothetical protein
VRITPSIIPNRDSIPQNQPRPKDAVSKIAGAAASMGGIAGDSVSILCARFMAVSVVFDSWFACESIVGEQAHRNDIIPRKNKHERRVVQHLFFILVVLSFWIPVFCPVKKTGRCFVLRPSSKKQLLTHAEVFAVLKSSRQRNTAADSMSL